MSEKINSELLRRNAPKNIGDQIHINHDGCSAGTDTKRRLYIKKVPGGILGYCHHCSGTGFIQLVSPEGHELSKWLKGDETADVPSVTTGVVAAGPLPFTGSPGDLWLHKYLTDPIDVKYICGTGDPTQVLLKIYTYEHPTHVGYQIRNTAAKPKYLTYYIKDAFRGDAAWFIAPRTIDLVITEDYLSAYKIFKLCNITTVALLKTTASDVTVRQIAEFNPHKVLVWLDNDVAGMRGSTKLVSRLQYVLSKGTTILSATTSRDPKDEAEDVIRRIVLCLT